MLLGMEYHDRRDWVLVTVRWSILHDKEGFVFQASLSEAKNYVPHHIIRPPHRIEPPVDGKMLSEMP